MKRFIYFFAAVWAVANICSCKDQDDVYKEFVVLNGYKYPQKADSLKVVPGYNRLKLTWLKAVDLTNPPDTIEVSIDNLVEDTYTFYVKTFDNEGNSSIVSEVSGTSYGDNYYMSLTERSIEKAMRSSDYTGTITWGAVTSDLLYTEVRYMTNAGDYNVVRALSTETTTQCPDAKPGELFEYHSVFLPSGGMDSLSIDWSESDAPFMYEYPRTEWTGTARNGNHSWGDGGGGTPDLVFDGNTSTGWHSKVGAAFPQVFVVDAKESLVFNSFKIILTSRTDWRYLVTVKVYVSETELPADAPDESWGEPAITTTYDSSEEFLIELPADVKGRYVAFVFPDSKSGSPYISFMEIYGYGY